MEIKDRIRMVIDSHQLTAGAFADRIGVQRSNVSHVLSGRNKPSFEFLEKVLTAFPKVQAHWLLTGKQQVAAGDPVSPLLQAKGSLLVTEDPQVAYGTRQGTEKIADKPERKVVKIVTFYSDFTFDTHFPSER